MKNPRLRGLLASAMLVIGTLTLTYPFAAQWVEQYHQSKANEILAEAAKAAGPSRLAQVYEEAAAYNSDLAAGRAVIGDGRYGTQMQLPETDVMARLRIPAIQLDQPIRHTMGEPALLAGVGHAEGTSLPVGGADTHAVLGGHRGLAQSVGFTHLPQVKAGDRIYIETLGKTLTYEVIETETLEPLEAAVHPIEAGRDLVSLLTCTPLGVNSHRFVVTAERVLPGDPELFGEASGLPGFPWWAAGGGLGLLGAAGVGVLAARLTPRA